MTALAAILMERINAAGPMTVAEYMGECLLHPVHGYYTTRDPLGAAGDFTTAPEISQMFGELLGLSLAQAWIDQERPGRVILAELGPGRGTLLADVLRATAQVPGFTNALEVHLVETSPVFRAAQAAAIDRPVIHHDSIATLPQAPLFLVANEFFDALPIRQFVREGAAWRERVIGIEHGQLIYWLSDPLALPSLVARDDVAEGQMVEHCPALAAIVGEIGRRIADHGGAAIIVDYGDWRSLGDTLQALKAHASVDPLAEPGFVDLTAHVDFEAIARAAAPAKATAMIAQGVLLERLGIAERAKALAYGLSGAALSSHIAAHRRLTHPKEMGNLFKAIAIHPISRPAPAGFDP